MLIQDDRRIIVALDGMDLNDACAVTHRIAGAPGVWGVKVNALLAEGGVSVVRSLAGFGVKVFADLKLHDIPETVRNWVGRYSVAGADLITVHASGHVAMMVEAVAAASGVHFLRGKNDTRGPTRILAVTALTSLDDDACMDVYNTYPKGTVLRLGNLAKTADVEGVVCSSKEVADMAKLFESGLRVVPGIRPAWFQEKGDQKRTATPREAIEAGATHLVMGRPLLKGDVAANLARTYEEIAGVGAVKA